VPEIKFNNLAASSGKIRRMPAERHVNGHKKRRSHVCRERERERDREREGGERKKRKEISKFSRNALDRSSLSLKSHLHRIRRFIRATRELAENSPRADYHRPHPSGNNYGIKRIKR